MLIQIWRAPGVAWSRAAKPCCPRRVLTQLQLGLERSNHSRSRKESGCNNQGSSPPLRQRPAASSVLLNAREARSRTPSCTECRPWPNQPVTAPELPCSASPLSSSLHSKAERPQEAKQLSEKKKKKEEKSLKIACPGRSQERKVNSLCSKRPASRLPAGKLAC